MDSVNLFLKNIISDNYIYFDIYLYLKPNEDQDEIFLSKKIGNKKGVIESLSIV